jgi:hypothetical protein
MKMKLRENLKKEGLYNEIKLRKQNEFLEVLRFNNQKINLKKKVSLSLIHLKVLKNIKIVISSF